MAQEVAGRAKGILAVVAAMEHFSDDGEGKVLLRCGEVGGLRDRADGCRGAGKQCMEGIAALVGPGGLVGDRAHPASPGENGWRHPTARVAIDAGGIDEEVT